MILTNLDDSAYDPTFQTRLDDFQAVPTDTDAIHDNVAAEIALITAKTTPVDADLLLIEDSAAANVKKRMSIGDLHAPYSLVDGTRPFTGVVGGIDPMADTHLATKGYVDDAINFTAEYLLNNTASDIGGIYYDMLDTSTGEAESSFTIAGLGTGDDQALVNWATLAGVPGVITLEAGIYSGHLHAEVTVGNKPTRLYFAIYTRTSGGAETLRATSHLSDLITSKTELEIHAVLASDVVINTTDRIVVKWFANVGTTGSNVTVVLYAEGTTASRLAIPITTEVLSSVFVRQDGTTPLTAPWAAGDVISATTFIAPTFENTAGDIDIIAFSAAGDTTVTIKNTSPGKFANLVVTGTLQINGVATITGLATGGLTDYDLKVGDTTTPDYGMIQFGNAVIGRTSYNVGAIDLDGTIMVRNIGGPVTSEVEFIWTESAGNTCRFALPKSAVGNATYNSRSMLLAGPAPADTDFVKVTYWQTTNSIFHNLACDTDGSGADLGVQNDLEVEGDIFVDSILESTTAAGVTIDSVLLKDGLVDGRDVAVDGALLDTAMQDLVDDTTPTLGGNLDVSTNYFDWGEIAAPANPAVNVARMYCKDDGGTTKLFFRDSAGAETEMGGGGGSGDVTAAANLGDNEIIRGDGGVKGVQDSGAYIDDSGNLGLGQAVPASLLHLEKAGTAKANLDIMRIVNPVNAADMDGTGTSILLRQYYYDAVTPAVVDMGRLGMETLTDWLVAGSSQDSMFKLDLNQGGTMTRKMELHARSSDQGVLELFCGVRAQRSGVNTPFQCVDYSNTGSHEAQFSIRKARGVYGTPLVVQDGDAIGGLDWRAYLNGSFRTKVEVKAVMNGTISGSNGPMDLAFKVSPAGVGSPVDVLVMDSAGDITLSTVGVRLNLGGTDLYLEDTAGTLSIGVGSSQRASFTTDRLNFFSASTVHGSIRHDSSFISIYHGTSTHVIRVGVNEASFVNKVRISAAHSNPDSTLDVDGDLALKDGMTAPGTTAGKAKLYVDTADGDLKIKFGDGTVKTIVTDT